MAPTQPEKQATMEHHTNSSTVTTPLIRYPPSNNSLLSSGNVKKSSMAYEPRTEAISPALNDDPLNAEDSASRSTKDEQTLLVEKLKKVEAEILSTDLQTSRLRKQIEQLEQASASKDDDDQENVCDTKQLSIAKLVYHENRAKAQKAHAKLEHIAGPPRDLPLYNQPSDNVIYHQNATKFACSFKKRLTSTLRQRLQARIKVEESVSTEYNRRMEKWLKSIEREDSQPNKRMRDAKTREFFEKQFPELKKARESGERFSRVGQRVARSDAEVDELLDGITEREDQDRRVKSYAVIPPMLEEMRSRRPKYINTNGYVDDILAEYKKYQILNTWTKEEKEIFKENYLQHPKNFGFIAGTLSGKNVTNCVQYYYLSKKSENYKQLLKRQQKRRTRSFVRPTTTVTETSNDASKSNGFNSSDKNAGDENVADASNQSVDQSNFVKSSALSRTEGGEAALSNDASKQSHTEPASTCCICNCEFDSTNQYRNVTRSNHQLYGIGAETLKPGMRICYSCRFRHVKHPSFDEPEASPEPDFSLDSSNAMEVDPPAPQPENFTSQAGPFTKTQPDAVVPVTSSVPNGPIEPQPMVGITESNKTQPRTCVRDIIYQAIEMSFQNPKPESIDNLAKIKPPIQPMQPVQPPSSIPPLGLAPTPLQHQLPSSMHVRPSLQTLPLPVPNLPHVPSYGPPDIQQQLAMQYKDHPLSQPYLPHQIQPRHPAPMALRPANLPNPPIRIGSVPPPPPPITHIPMYPAPRPQAPPPPPPPQQASQPPPPPQPQPQPQPSQPQPIVSHPPPTQKISSSVPPNLSQSVPVNYPMNLQRKFSEPVTFQKPVRTQPPKPRQPPAAHGIKGPPKTASPRAVGFENGVLDLSKKPDEETPPRRQSPIAIAEPVPLLQVEKEAPPPPPPAQAPAPAPVREERTIKKEAPAKEGIKEDVLTKKSTSNEGIAREITAAVSMEDASVKEIAPLEPPTKDSTPAEEAPRGSIELLDKVRPAEEIKSEASIEKPSALVIDAPDAIAKAPLLSTDPVTPDTPSTPPPLSITSSPPSPSTPPPLTITTSPPPASSPPTDTIPDDILPTTQDGDSPVRNSQTVETKIEIKEDNEVKDKRDDVDEAKNSQSVNPVNSDAVEKSTAADDATSPSGLKESFPESPEAETPPPLSINSNASACEEPPVSSFGESLNNKSSPPASPAPSSKSPSPPGTPPMLSINSNHSASDETTTSKHDGEAETGGEDQSNGNIPSDEQETSDAPLQTEVKLEKISDAGDEKVSDDEITDSEVRPKKNDSEAKIQHPPQQETPKEDVMSAEKSS